MSVYFQTDRFSLYQGDCRIVLRDLSDCSVDSVVCDPPAGISFMGKDWDHNKGGRDAWVSWLTEVMRECLRVLKPGGHALVWALPRTSHWTGWAIESAGFEIRDRVSHLFGSGFPKSLDISKAIDAAAGADREAVPRTRIDGKSTGNAGATFMSGSSVSVNCPTPITDAAKQWNGWGTALKPACEDWWLCRKPLIGTVAENVLQHGTGGLNIDGCRIEGLKPQVTQGINSNPTSFHVATELRLSGDPNIGRWPANVIHDGSDEVLALFPETVSNGQVNPYDAKKQSSSIYGNYANEVRPPRPTNEGSAARFFYCAKATQEDRNEGLEGLSPTARPASHMTTRAERERGEHRTNASNRNIHPTVKPTDLMRYLCRLVTPPNGVVLDPFCGSGSTGKAAMLEGLKFIGIELQPEYCELAQRRIEAVTKQGLLFGVA